MKRYLSFVLYVQKIIKKTILKFKRYKFKLFLNNF